jgi:hypothetical protein
MLTRKASIIALVADAPGMRDPCEEKCEEARSSGERLLV